MNQQSKTKYANIEMQKDGEKWVFTHTQVERSHNTMAHLERTDPFECKVNSMPASTTTLRAHLHD